MEAFVRKSCMVSMCTTENKDARACPETVSSTRLGGAADPNSNGSSSGHHVGWGLVFVWFFFFFSGAAYSLPSLPSAFASPKAV